MNTRQDRPHLDILDRWASRAELARDLRAEGYSIQDVVVVRWAQRGEVPAPWYAPLVRVAQKRGFVDVTADLLASRRTPARTRESAA